MTWKGIPSKETTNWMVFLGGHFSHSLPIEPARSALMLSRINRPQFVNMEVFPFRSGLNLKNSSHSPLFVLKGIDFTTGHLFLFQGA